MIRKSEQIGARAARAEEVDQTMPFADRDLARRVEGAWAYLCVENARAQARLDPGSGASAIPIGGGHAVFMGTGSPLSQVQGVGLYGPVGDADFDRMEAFYRERKAPIMVEISSLADPSLLPILGGRGYRAYQQTHVLVRPITDGDTLSASESTPEQEDDPPAAGVRIEPVAPGEVAIWAKAVLRCFFPEPAGIPSPLREGAIAMASIPAVTSWLARVGDTIAGGGSLVIHQRLALIAGDGTLPEFRFQGVQSALLRARLDHARRNGCDLAVICTPPGSGSQRNAERQGFQVVYARTLMGRE